MSKYSLLKQSSKYSFSKEPSSSSLCGGSGAKKESMELQGNHTAAEFYKKRGKMMYILRQEYQCGWCPLGLIVKKVGLDTYQEMLRQERQAADYDRRLEWTSAAVRALSKAERFEKMKKTAIDSQ